MGDNSLLICWQLEFEETENHSDNVFVMMITCRTGDTEEKANKEQTFLNSETNDFFHASKKRNILSRQ